MNTRNQQIAVGGVLVSVPPVAYAVYVAIQDPATLASPTDWLSSAYTQAMMGGWLATLLGLVAGLPIALWLNRTAEASSRAHAEEERMTQERRRRRSVLNVIRDELDQSRGPLSNVSAGRLEHVRFSVARWQALGNSGDFHLIDDLDLLDELARTYGALDVVNLLAATWLSTFAASADDDRAAVAVLLSHAAGDAEVLVRSALDRLAPAS